MRKAFKAGVDNTSVLRHSRLLLDRCWSCQSSPALKCGMSRGSASRARSRPSS